MSVTGHNFRLFEYWAFFVEIQENLPRSNSNYSKFVYSTRGLRDRMSRISGYDKSADVFKACFRYPGEERDYWFIPFCDMFYHKIIFWTILKNSLFLESITPKPLHRIPRSTWIRFYPLSFLSWKRRRFYIRAKLVPARPRSHGHSSVGEWSKAPVEITDLNIGYNVVIIYN